MLIHDTSNDNLRVGIDARCLNTKHMRGMGKYVFEMMRNASDSQPVSWIMYADRPELPVIYPSTCRVELKVFDTRGYRFKAWEQLALPHQVRRDRLALLHCSASTLPYWQPVPTVVTIHDALPWRAKYDDAYESWYWYKLIPAAIKRCRAVITISESSRRDILELWPCIADRIHVIPHGVADEYMQDQPPVLSAAVREQIGQVPYLLYVGGVIERKRFAWAVKLMEALPDINIYLAVCGFTETEAHSVMPSLDPRVRGKIVFLHAVPESDMLGLYRCATAVLYPTLYEGFGFPALEAQAVGTPVLFSALGSLAELVGPGAEVLPPFELDAWVQALSRICSERKEVTKQNDQARVWARRFAWRESASKHVALYRTVTDR